MTLSIVHIGNVPPFRGGISTYCHNVSRELVNIGYNVIVVTTALYKENLSKRCYKVIHLNKVRSKTSYLTLNALMRMLRFSFKLSIFCDKLLLGILVTYVVKLQKPWPWRILRRFAETVRHLDILYDACSKHGIYAILTHHAAVRSLYALIIGDMLKVPVHIFIHGGYIFFEEKTRQPDKVLAKWILKVGDSFLCLTENTMRRARELGVPEQKMHNVRLGVNGQSFSLPERKLSHTRIRIGFIGYLAPYRGLAELIRAIGKADRKDIDLFLVGEDPLDYWSELKELIRQVKLERHVTYLGALNQDEYKMFLNKMDIMAFPLREGKTGSLLSCLEAQACGLPVLTTGGAGVKEFVQDGKTGIITGQGVGNLQLGLLRAIEHLESGKWDRKYIRQWALKFSWKAVAHNILHVFDESAPLCVKYCAS